MSRHSGSPIRRPLSSLHTCVRQHTSVVLGGITVNLCEEQISDWSRMSDAGLVVDASIRAAFTERFVRLARPVALRESADDEVGQFADHFALAAHRRIRHTNRSLKADALRARIQTWPDVVDGFCEMLVVETWARDFALVKRLQDSPSPLDHFYVLRPHLEERAVVLLRMRGVDADHYLIDDFLAHRLQHVERRVRNRSLLVGFNYLGVSLLDYILKRQFLYPDFIRFLKSHAQQQYDPGMIGDRSGDSQNDSEVELPPIRIHVPIMKGRSAYKVSQPHITAAIQLYPRLDANYPTHETILRKAFRQFTPDLIKRTPSERLAAVHLAARAAIEKALADIAGREIKTQREAEDAHEEKCYLQWRMDWEPFGIVAFAALLGISSQTANKQLGRYQEAAKEKKLFKDYDQLLSAHGVAWPKAPRRRAVRKEEDSCGDQCQ